MKIKEKLQIVISWIDARTVRERVVIMLTLLGVLWIGWDALLMQPLSASVNDQQARIEALYEEIEQAEQSAQRILVASHGDPDSDTRSSLQAAQGEKEELDRLLAQFTERLISPIEAARALEAVLEQHQSLRLIRLESLKAVPLLPDENDPPAESGDEGQQTPQVFRHGVAIELEGGYLATLAYLRALEALPWRFLWSQISLDVTAYPKATVRIVVQTLGLEEGWIGV
ncbi:MAG: hypothetical protein SVU69_09755 [Pseudomonadota bacterium]|nr:hypothetical protein [Pseudomonadota bacterium]